MTSALGPFDGPCRETTSPRQKRGYGYLYIDGKYWYAHRWAFFRAHGWLPPVVRHLCDNPPCIALKHLIPGTQADNLADCFERGRANRAKGERAPTAKLTEADVRQIRRDLSTTTPAEIARRYSVDHKTIRQIRDGNTWKEVGWD